MSWGKCFIYNLIRVHYDLASNIEYKPVRKISSITKVLLHIIGKFSSTIRIHVKFQEQSRN